MPLDLRVQFPAKYRRMSFKDEVRERLEHTLGHWGPVVRRVDVRFADINGPKGGIDTRCTILVSLTGAHEHVVHSEGTDAAHAFALSVPRIGRAVKRDLDRRGVATGRPRRSVAPKPAPAAVPEKQGRARITDTSLPGVSASDRRVGEGHSGRRNIRAASSKSTVALEDSVGQPSRKSTRKSANRSKPSQGKARAAVAKTVSPRARSQRGRRK